MDERIERTRLWCHACERHFIAELDMAVTGNHEVHCPCGHIHYRVVERGRVTGDRYRSSMGTVYVTGSWYTGASTTSGSAFLQQSWDNSTTNVCASGWSSGSTTSWATT